MWRKFTTFVLLFSVHDWLFIACAFCCLNLVFTSIEIDFMVYISLISIQFARWYLWLF